MPQGTIKRLVRDRGFGFIRGEGMREDLFFHRSAVQESSFDDLHEGETVEFEVEHDPRRGQDRAVNIRPAA
ncbi:MAG: cold shock domain-containing protein [Chloroflexi bacterium]|nr:cold shock domain-containing protein [Chloroflexota bacterium]